MSRAFASPASHNLAKKRTGFLSFFFFLIVSTRNGCPRRVYRAKIFFGFSVIARATLPENTPADGRPATRRRALCATISTAVRTRPSTPPTDAPRRTPRRHANQYTKRAHLRVRVWAAQRNNNYYVREEISRTPSTVALCSQNHFQNFSIRILYKIKNTKVQDYFRKCSYNCILVNAVGEFIELKSIINQNRFFFSFRLRKVRGIFY